MQTNFIEFVYLVLIILALVMLANKLRVAYPIVLVIGGLALSFTSAFYRRIESVNVGTSLVSTWKNLAEVLDALLDPLL